MVWHDLRNWNDCIGFRKYKLICFGIKTVLCGDEMSISPFNENIIFPCLFLIFFNFLAGETASNLGTAMDELMRHQPTLKTDAMKAIIKV